MQSAWSGNRKDELCRSGEVLFNLDLSGECAGKIKVFVGNIEEIETYSHIEWEEDFKEDVAMTMTGFSDVLVRRGREEGRKEGREEGRIEGREEGREIGQEETTVKFIWSLHEMKCTDEMISEAVKKPVDYVQDILKKDAPQ